MICLSLSAKLKHTDGDNDGHLLVIMHISLT